ncbi:hypothetical protein D6851_15660 [Altericroceibacterium spongiae]|uniref:Uncharacterized protein n=1 Tax=Altericroceibacterium spongiae TaxID=2320269 RepID=A0A420EAI5_9SPHN|nr:hypothetical protein [Altericroceibacterium spongiae]RKF17696.1 hypothetical protein D6851_15660 [Altericroceibacterium spongiae]
MAARKYDSIQGSNSPVESGLFYIIDKVMTEKKVSRRQLWRDGVISERVFRSFEKKITSGALSLAELEAIQSYLGIDKIRAFLAVSTLDCPQSYFNATCETLSNLTAEFAAMLIDLHSATQGRIEPLPTRQAKALAGKNKKLLLDHHMRRQNDDLPGFA